MTLADMTDLEVRHVGRCVEVALGLLGDELDAIAETLLATEVSPLAGRVRSAAADVRCFAAKWAAVTETLAGRLGHEARGARPRMRPMMDDCTSTDRDQGRPACVETPAGTPALTDERPGTDGGRCRVPGCTMRQKAAGLCLKHYALWKQGGQWIGQFAIDTPPPAEQDGTPAAEQAMEPEIHDGPQCAGDPAAPAATPRQKDTTMARQKTTEACPVAGCTRPKGHTGRHNNQGGAKRARPKAAGRRIEARTIAVAVPPAADAVLISTAAKLTELCQAMGITVHTLPVAAGVAFACEQTGRVAVLAADGAVRAARLEVEGQ
ncbi:MAG: hypothetical protein GX591_02385 [Planctomycetes bacterium]|nr:hypothetical protein [Planctomycetota bacterium]